MKFESTVIPVPAQTMHRRAVSVARRLLAGSGCASVLAFREDPQTCLEAISHGMLPDGTFVIAVAPGEDVPAYSDPHSGSVDVRLDIEKFAPDAELVIRAATLHALGRLTWVDAATALRWRADGQLPELLAEVSELPGVRLAEVESPRILLHDCAGVTPLDWADVEDPTAPAAFPELLDEFSATDIVGEVSTSAWLEIIESVLTGHLVGTELTRLDLPGACPHVLGTVRIVDIDSMGVTVMHFTQAAAATILVPFDTPAATLDGLRDRVQALLPLGWVASL